MQKVKQRLRRLLCRGELKTMILVNDIKAERNGWIIQQEVFYIVYKKWFRWRYYWYKHIGLYFPYIFFTIGDAQLAMQELQAIK